MNAFHPEKWMAGIKMTVSEIRWHYYCIVLIMRGSIL